ncbi:MAG: efflux RND transporter periplasmic adaptor subunit [Lentisphaeria bacterium]|nr:efflux RND transporter periplasmic adaptor subunit [Lentisphaeria bacterium]
MKKIVKAAVAAAVTGLVAGGLFWGFGNFKNSGSKTLFNTEKVEKTDLVNTISATGTVEPEELVNVGAQVGGLITKFGSDADGKEVDYGSKVKAGAVLAHIDDSLYSVAVREAEAEKLRAEASIASSKANIALAKAQFQLADVTWQRAQKLLPKKAIAQSEYDSAHSDYIAKKAAIAVNEAQLAVSEAQLAGAIASLDRAVRNLGYCVISSPVEGVIIDRRVSIGQTVNASMNAPSLFLIAKDLKKMQVWVSVNEADIGSIKPGMPVEFTVDTFPGRLFYGKVFKIRLNATMSQNVVTYVVEVSADNSDGKLLPYLTANVKFIRSSRKNVPAVSNAALRFIPDPGLVAAADRKILEEISSGNMRRSRERIVWRLDDNKKLRAVKITTGLNDGIMTEIVKGELKEGDKVVSGVTLVSGDAPKNQPAGGSPFMPKPPQRKRR